MINQIVTVHFAITNGSSVFSTFRGFTCTYTTPEKGNSSFICVVGIWSLYSSYTFRGSTVEIQLASKQTLLLGTIKYF